MPRPTTWRQLAPGLVIAGLIAGLAAFVVFRARIGGLNGPTFPLYVAGRQVGGIVPGSEVWLAGQRVGAVERIVFRPPTVSAESRLLVQLKILDRARPAIRKDSRVDFRSGGSVIGVQVVYLSIGTSRAAMVRKGDTLVMAPPPDVGAVAVKATAALHEFPTVMSNVRQIVAAARSSESRIAVVRADLDTTADDWGLSHGESRVTARMQSKIGEAGRLDSLIGAMKLTATVGAESTQSLALRRRDDLSRILGDTALRAATRRLAQDQALIQSNTRGNDAALGRVRSDTAVRSGLASAFLALHALLADVTAHPFRYISAL